MNILLFENAVNENSPRKINLRKLVEYFEKSYHCSFERLVDEENIIYEYCKAPDTMLCLRTLQKLPEEDQWIEEMIRQINKYVEKYEDLNLILHIGAGGHKMNNYYEYPSVRAVMKSKIDEHRVYFYSTYDVPVRIFRNDTNPNYQIVSATDPDKLLSNLLPLMEKN